MERIDVQSLRDAFIRQGIMLCFNGPFSATLIEEIGQALRKHMEGLHESQSSVTDVFTAYIEITQNIRHYSMVNELAGTDAQATLIVSRNDDGRYVVSAGNVVYTRDGEALVKRIEELATLDKTELKAAFKAQLRQPRDPAAKTGAGLGLIDLARRSSEPLAGELVAMNGEFSFFSLRVVI
jgi:hypothetical protein